MRDDLITILQARDAATPMTAGFNVPLKLDRLIVAFGENLGGNPPAPSWFEGWDVMIATRQRSGRTIHMPTAVLLRRTTDGALRLMASDHFTRGDELGADLILGPQHVAWALDTIEQACDDDGRARIAAYAGSIIDSAIPELSPEPANLMQERMRDDDLADRTGLKRMTATIDDLAAGVASIRSATRRSEATRLVESLRRTLSPDA